MALNHEVRSSIIEVMIQDDELASEEEIRLALDSLQIRLKAEYGSSLEKLVLFGSRARGDYDSRSDVDVAIVVSGLTAKHKRHIYDIVAEIELEHLSPLSTIVLSLESFRELLKRERRIAVDIENEGIAI